MSDRSLLISPPAPASALDRAVTDTSRRLDPTERSWRGLVWLAPVVLAGAYLIVLVVDFSPVITSINTFGDAVIAPVLAKLAGQAAPDSQVVLGHHPYYEEFLFLRATAGLPFYRTLWNVAPAVWTLLGVGLLSWSAWRALGRSAAALTGSALLCLSALGRFVFFTFNWHGVTLIHTILIGCALVWLAPRAAEISWRRLVISALALGLVSALPAASDVLFLVWALAPMAVVAGVLCYLGAGRGRWTPAVFTVITVGVSVGVGVIIGGVLRASDVTSKAFPFSVAGSPEGLLHNLELLWKSLVALGGGDLTAPLDGWLRYPKLVSGILVVVAIGLALFASGRRAAGAVRKLRHSGPGLGGASAGTGGATAARAYLAFWGSSLVVTCLAYVGSDVPKLTTASSRYALAAYVAILALFPLMALRGGRWRAFITAGTCVFMVSAIVQLAVQPFVRFGPYPTPTVAARVLAFARAHDVRYGFAGYWDAPAITWMTDFRLQLYPVRFGCAPDVTCPVQTARVSSWYSPRPGTRSLLIADRADPDFAWLDPRLGPPLATVHIGTMTVAAYSYDIASELRFPFPTAPVGSPT
jgi:hypothetical protein